MWRRPAVLVLAVCACATHDAPDAGPDTAVDARPLQDTLDVAESSSDTRGAVDALDAAGADGFVRVSGSFPPTTRLEIADPDLLAVCSYSHSCIVATATPIVDGLSGLRRGDEVTAPVAPTTRSRVAVEGP